MRINLFILNKFLNNLRDIYLYFKLLLEHVLEWICGSFN